MTGAPSPVRRGYTWSEPPLPGESLVGFVARNLERHGLDRLQVCLQPVGIDLAYPGSLAVSHHDKAAEVAELFRVEAGEVAARTHPPVPGTGKKSLVSFFGEPIRRTFVEIVDRRVSPRSLARSPHHRALWHLRPLDFCGESRELLTSRCPAPACAQALGWQLTEGPARCEHCGTDLREHPQPLVECTDQEALDFVVGLVDPTPSKGEAATRLVPAKLAHCGRGELFEFAVMLADALYQTPCEGMRTRRRLRTVADFGRLNAQRLAEAGRILIDWPGSLHVVADRIREGSTEREQTQHGIFKELGPLHSISADKMLPDRLKVALRAELDDNMRRASTLFRAGQFRTSDEWIPVSLAAAEYAIHPTALRRLIERWDFEALRGVRHSPVLVRRSQMRAVAAQHADGVSIAKAQRLLGLDQTGLAELADAGLVRVLTGPASEVTRGQLRYSMASLSDLVTSVEGVAVLAEEGERGLVRLDRAVRDHHPERVDWARLLAAVTGGSLTVYKPRDGRAASLSRSLYVEATDLGALSSLAGVAADVPSSDPTMSQRDASILLHVPQSKVDELIQSDLLEVTEGRLHCRHLVRASVHAFADRYMTAGEAAELAGCGFRALRARMAEAGLPPCTLYGPRQTPLWERRTVEAVLGSRRAKWPQPSRPRPSETSPCP